MTLPENIYSIADVRAMDKAAIEGEGIAGYTLMERAGRAAVEIALERFPVSRKWLVLCGTGNNAGDGYVVGRLAVQRGLDVDRPNGIFSVHCQHTQKIGYQVPSGGLHGAERRSI